MVLWWLADEVPLGWFERHSLAFGVGVFWRTDRYVCYALTNPMSMC